MIKTLPNGICILDNDTYLSKWVQGQGHLIMHQDVALQRNLRLIKPGDVVVDGGAALGDHTAAYLQAVGPSGYVFAFEPNKEYVHCLSRNCPGAIWYDRALWFEHAWLRMDIEEVGNIGAGFISKDGQRHVEAVALDWLDLTRCDFIKLDVEGSELEALQGAVDTIKRCRPIIQCEINPPLLKKFGHTPEDVEAWLKVRGYRTERFGTPSELGAHELMAHPL